VCPRITLWFPIGNSFNDDERFVAAGYDNGDIKMFDLRMMSLKWETNVKSGVSGKTKETASQ